MKVPYSPSGGSASTSSPATWSTYADAVAWTATADLSQGGGVGLVLGDIGDGWSIGGVDLDTSRQQDGSPMPWVTEIVRNLETYIEVSPSGTGFKAFFLYKSAALSDLISALNPDGGHRLGRKWTLGNGEHPSAIEIYLSGRYFAITGVEPGPKLGLPIPLRRVETSVLADFIGDKVPAILARYAVRPAPLASPAAPPRPPTFVNADGVQGDLLARVADASARNATLARRWSGDWSGLHDCSRSAKAMALVSTLKGAGFGAEETAALLRYHPATSEWMAEKGDDAGGREFRRTFQRADPPPERIPPVFSPIGGATTPLMEDWPAPDITLATADNLAPPAFPLNIFSKPWAEWLQDVAGAKGAPVDYAGLALLVAAGGLIGNSRWAAAHRDWVEPPALYAALVGTPSSNKSPALNEVTRHIQRIQAKCNEDWADRQREFDSAKAIAAQHRAAWDQAVKEAVKQGDTPPARPLAADEPPAIAPRALLTNDATVEAAAELSQQNPQGLILIRDELAGWLGGMDAFKSTKGSDRAFWLEARSGDPRTTNRKKDGGQPSFVPHLLWSLLGGIQPDKLNEMMLAVADDGLTARLVYGWPAPPPIIETAAASSSLDRAEIWLERLHNLPWMPPEPVLIPLNDAALAELHRWRVRVGELERGSSSHFVSWSGKLPGFALRISLILAYLDWAPSVPLFRPINGTGAFSGATPNSAPPQQIDEMAMRRAVAFLDGYAVPMARRVFGEAALPEAERDSRKVARWLLKQRPMPSKLNVRELRRMAGGPGIKDAAHLEAALGELAALGWVREVDKPHHARGGRSRNDWIVNPRLRPL